MTTSIISYKKLKMVLYLKEKLQGKNTSSLKVASTNHPKRFGEVYAYDAPLYDGPSDAAIVVARKQGMEMRSDLAGMHLHSSCTIVFVNGVHKESSLQVMGRALDNKDETKTLAIVGGTGNFKFAQGTIHRHKVRDVSTDNFQHFKYVIDVTFGGPRSNL